MNYAERFQQLASDPVFIVGPARSGTTWTYDILTAHPQVAGVYESWLFTPQNGIGSLFTAAHYPARNSGLGRLIDRQEVVDLAREMVKEIMGRVIEPHHRLLVEKSPNHIYAVALIREIFPQAKFIHLLRDGRDVYVSVRAAAKSWSPGWQNSFGRSTATAARAWRGEVERAQTASQLLGPDFLSVRYEELHAEPIAGIQRLYDFCSLPYDEALLNTIFETTDFKKNYKGGETKFRRGGRVGDWRKQFTLWDALIYNLIAGQTLIDLGYEKNRFWWPRFWSVG